MEHKSSQHPAISIDIYFFSGGGGVAVIAIRNAYIFVMLRLNAPLVKLLVLFDYIYRYCIGTRFNVLQEKETYFVIM